MHVQRRKPSGERRLLTPEWAINDVKLRALLVVFMEVRLDIRNPRGTLLERRERCRLVAVGQRPRLAAKATKLNHEYVTTTDPARRKQLQVEIENLDTTIRYTHDGGMATLAAVAYLYYRVRLDSVAVAAELELKPPHVRQILWRLDQLWKKRFNLDGTEKELAPPKLYKRRSVSGRRTRWDLKAAIPLREARMSYAEIGARFGVVGESVRTAFVQAGIIFPKVRRPRPRGHKFDHRAALEMKKAGSTFREIAEHFGVDEASVRYAINKSPFLNLDHPFPSKSKRAEFSPGPLPQHAPPNAVPETR